MARLIDKDKLQKKIAWYDQQNMILCIEDVLDIIEKFPEDAPILTTPNEPLTLEQLREMDGNPVWVVPRGMYENFEPLWCVLERSMALIPGEEAYFSWDFDGYGEIWIAYRRPPEGDEKQNG